MVDYKKILQLDNAGVSGRGIAEALGCSRNTVAVVLGSARSRGVTFEQAGSLDAAAVRRLLLPEPKSKPEPGRAAPDYAVIHAELARPNVTLQLLWAEYCARAREAGEVPFAYPTFTRQYRQWARVTGATMTIARKPGELMEVDWAGDTMEFFDAGTGEARTAYLFVAALPFSAYLFVDAYPDMTLDSWIAAHVAAFEFFGGATRLLVPDNLKTGVSKADRYEPALNPAYAQLADHYGTAVIPARVRRPRDKAMAENAVRHGANKVSATLRDRVFVGIGELRDAIAVQVAAINAGPFQKRAGSRLEAFTTTESSTLIPLPAIPFELAHLRKAKVGPNYHVQVDGGFYSVPSRLIGKTLDVRVTSRLVEVFDGTERVATHPRLAVKGAYQTATDHMPSAHQAQLEQWTPKRFTDWADQIGPYTRQTVDAVLASRRVVEQSYRSALGLLSLAKKPGGAQRLEDSCALALGTTTRPSYSLVKRLWSTWQAPPTRPTSLGDTGFVRGADYYAREATR
ncbi:MAG: IS21 family transposase [Promicromonosporaceae bacterium]|nr:IS21 family transposase [Promicromonosporaceae bacterium]